MTYIKLLLTIIFAVTLASCAPTRKSVYGGEDNTIIFFPNSEVPTTSEAGSNFMDSAQQQCSTTLQAKNDITTNIRLYSFIDTWIHTPYKWGGSDKSGIDCSAFIQKLLAEVYNIKVPRTSLAQFLAQQVEPYRSREYLVEGDLIFFRTIPNTYISHVGLYLRDGMFVNASSSKGVSLASLDDPYWKSRYVAAARISRDR